MISIFIEYLQIFKMHFFITIMRAILLLPNGENERMAESSIAFSHSAFICLLYKMLLPDNPFVLQLSRLFLFFKQVRIKFPDIIFGYLIDGV